VQFGLEGRPYSRRLSLRFETPKDVWAYWRCEGKDELSRVGDLSAGGLFLETKNSHPEGVKLKIDFLVQEGQIRAEAEVRHTEVRGGMGLKFTAISEDDCHRLIELLRRARSEHRPQTVSAASEAD
jgi:c-di-GMP-binding flagellar brake protein YcgR